MGGMISYILSDYNTTIRARQAEQDEGHDKRMNDHLFPIFIKSIFLRV